MVKARTIKSALVFITISLALNFQSLYSMDLISNKSCFLSFEQNDWGGVICYDLSICISRSIICIVAPQLLKELFKTNPGFQKQFAAGKLTCLVSKSRLSDGTPQLVVIMPASLEELGIKIPESEKQKAEPAVGISALEDKYGFRNLNLLNPEFVAPIIEKAAQVESDEFKKILNFPNIINSGLPNHPTRFYLDGHGNIGLVAGLPMNLFGDFLADLTKIGTEFIYILSCYAAGNTPEIQSALANIINKQIEESKKLKTASVHGIDYAIVIQATTDVSTCDVGDIKTMFTQLDEFLKNPVWVLEFGSEVKRPKITIADVIATLGVKIGHSLPSIRMPGKTQFFRSVNIGNMEIITESRLIELGVEKTLKLISESKSRVKNIAHAARKKLKGNLDIEILIKPDIEFIQIFPMDLLDFAFVLHQRSKFISKLSGQGQHYIGKIVDSAFGSIDELVNQGFLKIWDIQ